MPCRSGCSASMRKSLKTLQRRFTLPLHQSVGNTVELRIQLFSCSALRPAARRAGCTWGLQRYGGVTFPLLLRRQREELGGPPIRHPLEGSKGAALRSGWLPGVLLLSGDDSRRDLLPWLLCDRGARYTARRTARRRLPHRRLSLGGNARSRNGLTGLQRYGRVRDLLLWLLSDWVLWLLCRGAALGGAGRAGHFFLI